MDDQKLKDIFNTSARQEVAPKLSRHEELLLGKIEAYERKRKFVAATGIAVLFLIGGGFWHFQKQITSVDELEETYAILEDVISDYGQNGNGNDLEIYDRWEFIDER